MNMQQLLRQAEEMQDKMQRELSDINVEANVGGGMVECTMNGHKHLLSIKIDPESIDLEDMTLLEDLVVAAVNDAQRKVDELLKSRLGSMAGSLPNIF